MTKKTTLTATLYVTLTLFLAALAGAQPQTISNQLLLPSFEVDLNGARTTFFSVVNSSDTRAEIEMDVYSNWGIEIFSTKAALAAHEAKVFNLSSWLLQGQLPDRTLSEEDLAHAQAALSGKASPRGNLYYSTETEIDLAFGFIRIRQTSGLGTVFGDFFVLDPLGDNAEGDLLLDTAPAACAGPACTDHGVRFFLGGALGTDTELMVWSARPSQASQSPYFQEKQMIEAELHVYRQNGELVEVRRMDFLPLQAIKVSELGFDAQAGWIRLVTDENTFVAVRYHADDRFSVGLRAVCLPPEEDPTCQGDDCPTCSGGDCPQPTPRIKIEKHTNGEDADEPAGPTIREGEPVLWEYFVTNTGNEALIDVTVTDDQGVAVSCPKDELATGESMKCTGNGTASLGQYENIGTATGLGADSGNPASDTDPSHYIGIPSNPDVPSIDLEKATNGQDADAAPGPSIPAGDPVTWTYDVTNTGSVDLFDVAVSDDQGVAVSCPKTTLAVGESMKCTGNGTAVEGQYTNLGTVNGKADIEGTTVPVTDSDPSHYFGTTPPKAAIDIEKATNGHDADAAPGPSIPAGDPVTWTYVVTNTGEVALANVQVSDNRGVAVSCPKTSLTVGESMTCTGHGTATEGQYSNMGTATGEGAGTTVTDSDLSHYYGEPVSSGFQGCTPGYWKNHTDSWTAAGYSPSQSTQSVFSAASAYPAYGSASLLDALSFKGGSGVEGGVGNLLRAAVAGLLNTSHGGVDYPRATASLISDVNAALSSGDRGAMLALASSIDSDNNLGCPLN